MRENISGRNEIDCSGARLDARKGRGRKGRQFVRKFKDKQT